MKTQDTPLSLVSASVRGFLDRIGVLRSWRWGFPDDGDVSATVMRDTSTPERFDAPKRLQSNDKGFFTSPTYLRQMQRADWQHTDRRIQEFAARLVLELRKRRIPVFVHCAYRTPAEQSELLAKGHSKAGPARAPHCRGAAVDIVHSRFAWSMNRDEWALIGQLGKDVAHRMGISVDWGGDWSFWDPAHWQLSDWDTLEVPLAPSEPIRLTPHAIKSRGWNYVKGYTGRRSRR